MEGEERWAAINRSVSVIVSLNLHPKTCRGRADKIDEGVELPFHV